MNQELFKATFEDFYCEDGDSAHKFQLRTQERMADSIVTGSEIKRAINCLDLYKSAGPDAHFPKAHKAPSFHVVSVHTNMFNLSLQAARNPEDWLRAIVTLHNRLK